MFAIYLPYFETMIFQKRVGTLLGLFLSSSADPDSKIRVPKSRVVVLGSHELQPKRGLIGPDVSFVLS